jgi:uracil DNA glycosylase
MSSNINSKDIINKQKEKYAEFPWSKFLLQEFDKPTFEKMLDKLIAGVSNDKPFTPPMKSWFSDFTTMSPADLKVLVISKGPVEFPSEFASQELLTSQGVMFYNLSRTAVGTDQMMEDWRMFNIYFIDYLVSNIPDIVYVFVGFEASDFSEMVNEDTYGNKVFLPEQSHAIWKSNALYKLFDENVNLILESKGISAISW